MNLAEHLRTSLEAIEHARQAGDCREETELLTNLVAGLAWGPTPVEHVLVQAEAIEREHAGDRKLEGAVLRAKAHCHAMLGSFDEARALAKRAGAIMAELGLSLDLAGSSMLVARIEMRAGDLEAAERVLREGFDRLRAMDERGFASTVASLLGIVRASQGRDSEAERFCLESRELAAEEDVISQTEWRTGMVPVLLRRGEPERAEELAREALAIVETTDMPTPQGDTWVCLADMLEATGRRGESRDALREALDRYELKGDVVRAGPIRERLRAEV
jgi:tetratricopeptide (TPR) repeat protein